MDVLFFRARVWGLGGGFGFEESICEESYKDLSL